MPCNDSQQHSTAFGDAPLNCAPLTTHSTVLRTLMLIAPCHGQDCVAGKAVAIAGATGYNEAGVPTTAVRLRMDEGRFVEQHSVEDDNGSASGVDLR
jgi:hypothetical protein